ncbi:acyltransferase family protein [Actinophytocola gossypii]|uniref:Acyltransferase n=1 Tax=Actinophytocola gossypii TaxID=2812003 RepID=A0ABT2JFC7_9PSEU|nr:acyltransferase [Actinophytocola gossypii]MCT2586580.1 acyltransferase [Actinophytocola gossypii]
MRPDRLTPDVRAGSNRTVFLDVARVFAALLVFYSHLYNDFIHAHKGAPVPPADWFQSSVLDQLKLDEGLGTVAVPIFFLLSGFVITPVALRRGAVRFGVYRVVRLYPMLIVAVTICAVLLSIGRYNPLSTLPQEVSVGSFLSNMSLWNFIDRPFGAWVAVAWTLAVEFLFYGLIILVLPLLRRKVWLAITAQLALVLVLILTHRLVAADEYRAFAMNMTWVLIPVIGQIIWAAWHRRIPAWLAALFVTAAWLMFSWGEKLAIDPTNNPKPYPLTIALVLFMIGLLAEPYLKPRRIWTELSRRSYGIFLLHGTVAFPLMHLLFDELPMWQSVPIAVGGTLLVNELCFHLIDRPSDRLARHLSRARRPEEPPPPPPPTPVRLPVPAGPPASERGRKRRVAR